MNFTYWTGFSKRRNSTKIPGTTGTVASCDLKEDTSIITPTIILKGHTFFGVNYGYIADFGRYYFVTDIKTAGPNTEISLTVDTLGTYKAAITGSSQYVDRAAQSGIAPANAPDPLNPPTNVIEHSQKTLLNLTTSPTIINWDTITQSITPRYVLGVVGKTGINYWSLSEVELETFFDKVFSLNFVQDFLSVFYDFRDCVISLKRVPYITTGSAGEQIYLGEKDLPMYAEAISMNHPIKADSGLTLIDFPSDVHLYIRSYPYYSPYTFATITLPFVGVVPLDVSLIASDGKLGVEITVDQVTADLVYRVYTTGGITLGIYYGNAGSDMPIASQNYNAAGIAGGAIQVIGGAVAAFVGGAAATTAKAASAARMAGAGAALAGVGSAVKGAEVNTQVNGSISSYLGGFTGLSVKVDVYTNKPVDWDIENMRTSQGVLVCKEMSLSSLTGFVSCANAHVSITGTDGEKQTIEELLNSGIFIE